MASTPEKPEPQDAEQPQTQDKEPQDTEQDAKNEETSAPVSDEQSEDQKNEKTAEHKEEQEAEETLQKEKTATTPAAHKTPAQAAAPTSATKRKFDALHARNSALDPSISEQEKNKKARASALMKSPAVRVAETKPAAARKGAKTRDFSFARPTASSARRTAAVASAHARAKVTTPLPARKPLHSKSNKYTPALVQRASMPAPKTSAMMDKAARPHFNYTPYSGPLPPLTVESSFAPKNLQGLERGARTASPARTKSSAVAKKVPSHSTTGKENAGVNTNGGSATNATSSSKTHRTPVKSSIGSPVSKDKNLSAVKEKVKGQRSAAQQNARLSPVPTTATPVEPTE